MSGLCPLPHGIGANDEPLRREAERDGLCEWHATVRDDLEWAERNNARDRVINTREGEQ